jgi:hypothetical protein
LRRLTEERAGGVKIVGVAGIRLYFALRKTMKQITGTWRLVRTRAKNDAGEVMHAPYGPKPMGLATFTSYGRMIAVLCDGRTTLDEVDREFNAYSGNYTFYGDTLTCRFRKFHPAWIRFVR